MAPVADVRLTPPTRFQMETSFTSDNLTAIAFVAVFSIVYTHGNFQLSPARPRGRAGAGLYALAACCSEDGAVQCDSYE